MGVWFVFDWYWITGKSVAKPIGAKTDVAGCNIVGYGKEAIIGPPKLELDYEISYEQARVNYLDLRDKLLELCNGYWLSVSADGRVVCINSTEEIAHNTVKKAINTYNRKQCIYTNCIGREILEEIHIGHIYGDMSVGGLDHVDYESKWVRLEDDALGENENVDIATVDGFFNGSKLLVCVVAGYSEDGKSFDDNAMGLDTAAQCSTVPSVFMQRLMKREEERFQELLFKQVRFGNSQQRTEMPMIPDVYFQIDGLITKSPVVGYDKFLIGYPVWKRYEISINLTRDPPLTMTKLAGEEDHAPLWIVFFVQG